MSTNRNPLPPSLVANLQQILMSRANGGEEAQSEVKEEESAAPAVDSEELASEKKPVVLITNADGIDSPGLASLVKGLATDARFEVNVCAPQFDKSASGHSLTVRETVEVTSTEISGATTSYEVSGTPADCVTLALSQALFSWSKPVLVISGINKGASSGLNMLYSGAIAGAREALIHGIPALCINLNWKKDVSSENDYKDAVDVCLPLINAVLRDVEKGDFPTGCLLNVEVPVCPSRSKLCYMDAAILALYPGRHDTTRIRVRNPARTRHFGLGHGTNWWRSSGEGNLTRKHENPSEGEFPVSEAGKRRGSSGKHPEDEWRKEVEWRKEAAAA